MTIELTADQISALRYVFGDVIEVYDDAGEGYESLQWTADRLREISAMIGEEGEEGEEG